MFAGDRDFDTLQCNQTYPDKGSTSDRPKHLDHDVKGTLDQRDISSDEQATCHSRVNVAARYVSDSLCTNKRDMKRIVLKKKKVTDKRVLVNSFFNVNDCKLQDLVTEYPKFSNKIKNSHTINKNSCVLNRVLHKSMTNL